MVPASASQPNEAASTQPRTDDKSPTEPQTDQKIEPVVKGDPEMSPLYVKRLLPMFTQTFRSSLVPSIRKATLAIMKKVIHLIPVDMMPNVIASSNVASSIVEVISAVLNAEVGHCVLKWLFCWILQKHCLML